MSYLLIVVSALVIAWIFVKCEEEHKRVEGRDK